FAGTSLFRTLEGQSLVIKDVAGDRRVRHKRELKKEGIASMIVAPIKSRERIIGMLSLHSAQKQDFSADVVTLVTALAHQGALAIENASLYLKLQQDKESLEQDIWSHRSWF
ncbi:MAG: GAF domain-containing protein, partial [Deltaproteobacteria bacterium]|nr:GAF domain-containing protein [Deltaproteobacteria bacterium]